MHEIIQDFVQAAALAGWILIKAYQLLVELRFLIQWFVNLNPYFEPFQTLWIITNPFFNFGRALYPKFLGYDMTPAVNFKLILTLESFLDKACHGIDPYNYYKFFPNIDPTIPRITPLSDLDLPDYIN